VPQTWRFAWCRDIVQPAPCAVEGALLELGRVVTDIVDDREPELARILPEHRAHHLSRAVRPARSQALHPPSGR